MRRIRQQLVWIAFLAISLVGAISGASAPSVRINEAMSSNYSVIKDDDGDYSDWIEIYNFGSNDVDLGSWGVSDRVENPFQWRFPAGTTIGAGQYLMLWASGKNREACARYEGMLISNQSRWRYYEGPLANTNWADRTYDDSNWKEDASPFATHSGIESGTVVGPASQRAYFRKEFTWSGESWQELWLDLNSSWGARVYLNGREVVQHLLQSSTIGAPTAQPLPFDGLRLWVAADRDLETREVEGAKLVSMWRDLSGASNHLASAVGVAQPFLSTNGWNGNPAIRFSGNQSLSSPEFYMGNHQTLFFVARPEDSPNHYSRLFAKGALSGGVQMTIYRNGDPMASLRVDTSGEGGAFNQVRFGGGVFNGEWQLLTVRLSPESAGFLQNGVPIVEHIYQWGDGVAGEQPLVIGAEYSGRWGFLEGDIAEVIVYDRLLSASEINNIERYLRLKYEGEAGKPAALSYQLPVEELVVGENILAIELVEQEAPLEGLYLDGRLRVSRVGKAFHTSFKLSAEGESVTLTAPSGIRVDHMPPIPLSRDVSLGRSAVDNGDWYFFRDATPGAANSTEAYAERIVRPVEYSHAAGFHNQPFRLILTHEDQDVAIIYTLDGSEPDLANLDGKTYVYKNQYPVNPGDSFGALLSTGFQTHLYSQPVWIYDRSAESNRLSSIYQSDPAHLPFQPVRKGTVVRAKAVKSGALDSPVETKSYFIFSNPYEVPVLSLSIQEDLLFDYHKGIYTPGIQYDHWRVRNPNGSHTRSRGNYHLTGRDWEYTLSVEVLPAGGDEFCQAQRTGVRIHGNVSRNWLAKNLRLYARPDDPRESHLIMPIMSERIRAVGGDIGEMRFGRVLLRRSGSPLGWPGDITASRLMLPFFKGLSRAEPVIKFINGEFWGLTYVRDRIDEHHIANIFGLSPENIVMTYFESAVGLTGMRHEVVVGGPEGRRMFEELEAAFYEADLSDDSRYADLLRIFDVQSFTDMIIMTAYLCNDHYEYGFWRAGEVDDSPYGDGRWRTYAKDFDKIPVPELAELTGRGYVGYLTNSVDMFSALIANEGYRRYFINRFADLLNSAFQPGRFVSLLEAQRHEVVNYLAEDGNRWNQDLINPFVYDRLERHATNHPAKQLAHLEELFDLDGVAKLTIQRTGGTGSVVRVNSLEIAENLPGLADPSTPFPWSGIYFRGIPVELEAIPARGGRFVGWRMAGHEEFYSTNQIIELTLSTDTSVEALFEKINLPPTINKSMILGPLVEGSGSWTIGLNTLAEDPDGDPVFIEVMSNATNVISATTSNSVLVLSPVRRGEATITIYAMDGHNPPVESAFNVLVYPSAHVLAGASYEFSFWSPDETAGSYPPHMIFLQGAENDSSLTTPLLRAYHIPVADASKPEDAVFPYRSDSRTRINGLGRDGVSFINTGRGRDLGAVLLALDTRNITSCSIQWLAGTVLANSRQYALRLQYRVGLAGSFADILDESNSPIEYRAQSAAHAQYMEPISLPAEALGQEYVQLLWRYHKVSGGSGPRAQLRLDDIVVAPVSPEPATRLQFADSPPVNWQSGLPLPFITILAVDASGLIDVNFSGRIEFSVSGPASLDGQFAVYADRGRAVLTNLIFMGSGECTLSASAGQVEVKWSPIRVVSINGVRMPRYIQGDKAENTNRIPFVYRARIEGLLPESSYRFGNSVVLPDDAWSQSGAGNAIFVTGSNSDWIRNRDTPRFGPDDSGRHWTFTTDSSGAYEGWFVIEPTGNYRFTPGNSVHMRIMLNDGREGESAEHFLTLADPVQVIRLGNLTNEASIWIGSAAGSARNAVFIYDEPTGQSRPVAGVPVERTGSQEDDKYAAFYNNLAAGTWGAFIPNYLSAGRHRVEVRKLDTDELLMVWVFEDGLSGSGQSTHGLSAMSLDVRPSPASYSFWRELAFTPAELADQNIAGPLADPDGTGLPNALRYALGLQRGEDPRSALPRALLLEAQPGFAYRRLINAFDELEYIVEITPDLRDAQSWSSKDLDQWLNVHAVEATGDGVTEEVLLVLPMDRAESAVYIRIRLNLRESP